MEKEYSRNVYFIARHATCRNVSEKFCIVYDFDCARF